jgi:hypothetical protein
MSVYAYYGRGHHACDIFGTIPISGILQILKSSNRSQKPSDHTVYRINSPPPFQANQPSEPDQVLVRPPYACCHTSTQRNHDSY